MRSGLQDVRPWLRVRCCGRFFAKGLERENASDHGRIVCGSSADRHPFALLASPTMAEEILQGQGSAAIVATAKTGDP